MTVSQSTALIVGCTLGGVFLAIALMLVIFVLVYFSPEAKGCIRKQKMEKAVEVIDKEQSLSWSQVPTLEVNNFNRPHIEHFPRDHNPKSQGQVGLDNRAFSNHYEPQAMLTSSPLRPNSQMADDKFDDAESYGRMVGEAFMFLEKI